MEGGTNNWWMFAKWSDEYEQGVDEYVKRAFAIKSQGNQICCSCQICHYHFLPCEGVVRDHLICNGFVPRLDKLSKLGFNTQREETILDNDEWSIPNDSRDDVVRLFHDAHDAFRQGPNDEAKFFLRLVEEWQEELYPGSKNHSKLSFMIRLLILKCDHNLTNAAFGDILELIREVLLYAKLPTSFNEAKSVLKVLGLDYTKIDACPNDCMIYLEEHENATSCHVCKTPRWKSKDKEDDIENGKGKTYRIPQKILSLYKEFSDDPCNVRLGLATDGFSPFNSMSIVHSNDLDIYLQPLMKDLKDLWEFGLETYDASSNQSGKNVYRENCKFLPPFHPWRRDKRNFDGKVEERHQPTPLNGIDVANLLRGFPNEFGKKQKKPRRVVDDPNPWKKRVIFFELPYWKHCLNRHNLDAMHIEKNVFDSVIGTLLEISQKTKDHVSAHRDLVELNLMPELQPRELEDGGEEFPRSCFWISLEQKRKFCQVFKNAKLLQGYASNIGRCVQVGERKIAGYKSHDAHFMMNYLLPIAVKTTLSKDVATPLIRLCAFFKKYME
ncbi:uncharacterized protein LOC110733719 [Chenopodium quinoa]|uniref:uncharacterized protein LOC110733719 n=1 Tax=Chenopodium quinoa TaxID=63459 RepID=UPI000B787059|nr:uncharacterized protein LOC110733719 [Chenopodium quinoa]